MIRRLAYLPVVIAATVALVVRCPGLPLWATCAAAALFGFTASAIAGYMDGRDDD